MKEASQTLFHAVNRNDYSLAQKMLSAGANPNSIFQLTKGKFISTMGLFISKVAQAGVHKGPNNHEYRSWMGLMKEVLLKGTLQCKCLKDHKCPLFIALEAFKITDETQILMNKCELIRFLIVNGATIKYDPKQTQKAHKSVAKWALRWMDIEGIRTYLITKNFKYVEQKVQCHDCTESTKNNENKQPNISKQCKQPISIPFPEAKQSS